MDIAIFATHNRPRALEIARETARWLLERGHAVRMEPALAEAAECPQCEAAAEGVAQGTELAISIGGDGTMLGAVRMTAPHGVPVLAVNAGALGFLTEIAPEDLLECLPRVLARDYDLEPRMLVHCDVFRGADRLGQYVALNDIVVKQGAKGRLINLDVMVAGHQLGRFGSDGVIIATPTGSTAYGLSAGGPIVHPAASVMVLVPICPHSLSFRPMVIPATDPVEVLCEANVHGDEMAVIADGQTELTVVSGDRVIVRPAAEHALLIKLDLGSFYDRLREKLQWGGG